MKTLFLNLRLIFSGDTVLLVLSILLFLASLANATHWPTLRTYRFCGVLTTFFSVGFFLLSSMELRKQPRQKRTIIAAILFFAALVFCFINTHIVIQPAN
jgi:Kef-type K+ transport system membrane component KefB